MNTSPNTDKALPFQLEYCSPSYRSRCPVHAGLNVWQIREALEGHPEFEYTNVFAVKLTTPGLVVVKFEILEDDHNSKKMNYLMQGMTIGELKAFFSNPLIESTDHTNVAEVVVHGVGDLFFVQAAADVEREYRIEGGNSNTGDIGFVAYIRASSKRAAREKLESVSINENPEALTFKEPGMEICIYLNPDRVVVKHEE